MRVGQGFDAHAFGDGDSVVIGGVEIPHAKGLSGHSDADVLSHAITDALLGAAGAGDLGDHFPASDRWEGASSLAILTEAGRLIGDAGYVIHNIDATVVAAAPRIAPHRERMRENIASALGLDPRVVSIKGTTTDGLGFTGRSEGIAALAVVLIDG